MVSIVSNLKLSKPVTGVPRATLAIVLYHDGGGYCAATQHKVTDEKLGLGRVVSLNRLGDRFQKFRKTLTTELLPTNVFMATDRLIAWNTGSRDAPMWFRIAGKSKCFRVRWPNLVWLLDTESRRLRLFAQARNQRPGLTTRLYHAPLMNIGINGELCEGSARLPNELNVTTIEDVEACVFESAFTHVNHDQTLAGGADNRRHVRYWRSKQLDNSVVRVAEMVFVNRLGELL